MRFIMRGSLTKQDHELVHGLFPIADRPNPLLFDFMQSRIERFYDGPFIRKGAPGSVTLCNEACSDSMARVIIDNLAGLLPVCIESEIRKRQLLHGHTFPSKSPCKV